jgi:hypothetical protein
VRIVAEIGESLPPRTDIHGRSDRSTRRVAFQRQRRCDLSYARLTERLCLRAGPTKEWRRGWDSNPRYGFPHARFRGEYFKPLSHLSAAVFRIFYHAWRPRRDICARVAPPLFPNNCENAAEPTEGLANSLIRANFTEDVVQGIRFRAHFRFCPLR